MFVFPFDLLSLDELSLLLFLRKIMIFLLFNPFYVKEVKAKFLINLFFNDKIVWYYNSYVFSYGLVFIWKNKDNKILKLQTKQVINKMYITMGNLLNKYASYNYLIYISLLHFLKTFSLFSNLNTCNKTKNS